MATDIFSSLYTKKDPFQELLARNALETSPISSPYQGLSRMAFALLAGKDIANKDREEEQVGQSLLNQPGLEGVAPQSMPKKGFSLSNLVPSFLKPSSSGSTDYTPILQREADRTGLDADYLSRVMKVESGGNPNNRTGSYRGLFQLSPTEFAKYGGTGNIYDPEQNTAAAANKTQAEAQAFKAKYGRDPTNTDLYMIHQQGEGGYANHLANPDAPAWQNMLNTGEGRQRGAAWAKQAIWGNIPDNLKARFGSVDSVTSRDLVNIYRGKVEGGDNVMRVSMEGGDKQAGRSRPNIPTEVQQQIARMVKTGNPALIQQATQLYNQYAAPKETWEPLVDPAARINAGILPNDTNSYQINSLTKQVKPVNPQPFAVNLQNQNESEFSKAYGKGQAERALKLEDAGNKANINFQRAQLLQKMLGDIQSGKITPAVGTVGAWMQSVGLNPESIGIDPKLPMTVEAMRGLSNEMVVGKIGASEGGFPANNFSDADRSFLQDTVLKLSDRPEANFIKLEVAKRIAKLEGDKADAWADARDNGVSFEKFERDWRREARKKDVFADLYEEAKNMAATPKGGAPSKDDLRKKYGLE